MAWTATERAAGRRADRRAGMARRAADALEEATLPEKAVREAIREAISTAGWGDALGAGAARIVRSNAVGACEGARSRPWLVGAPAGGGACEQWPEREW